MPSLSRSKALIVFILFAGLVLAGVGILANEPTDDVITETPTETEVLEAPPSPAKTDSGFESETTDRSEANVEPEPAGPPPLFPTKDMVTRKGFYLAFSTLYRQSPEEFRARAQMALDGPYSRAAKEAALQAWYRWNHEDRLSPIQKILSTPTTGDAMTAALQTFAVKQLAQEAPTAADCRSVLADFLETKPTDVKLRTQAYTSVLRWGHLKEIHRCLPTILAESDASCLQASAEALQQTTEGAAELIIRDLAKRHPRASARKQFKQILAQN
jgi:hypothetical protein